MSRFKHCQPAVLPSRQRRDSRLSRRLIMRCWLIRATAAFVLTLVVGASAPAAAQVGATGQIVGKAVDAGGGALPGVVVTLSGPGMMGTPTAETNESGAYRFPSVSTGTYTLNFQLSGFSTFVREGVIVS